MRRQLEEGAGGGRRCRGGIIGRRQRNERRGSRRRAKALVGQWTPGGQFLLLETRVLARVGCESCRQILRDARGCGRRRCGAVCSRQHVLHNAGSGVTGRGRSICATWAGAACGERRTSGDARAGNEKSLHQDSEMIKKIGSELTELPRAQGHHSRICEVMYAAMTVRAGGAKGRVLVRKGECWCERAGAGVSANSVVEDKVPIVCA